MKTATARLPVLSILGVSLAARLAFLARKSLWVDEALAAGVAGLGPGELVTKIATGTPHPPLAFLVIRLSALLFGHGETGLRLLIALAAASAAVPVFRLVLRRFGSPAAVWASLVWALCPFAVSLGQEAWVYGIYAALTLWLCDFADMAWRGSGRALIGFVLTGAAGLLTQHFFIFSVLAAVALYIVLPKDERVQWKVPLVWTGLLVLLYIPVFLTFLHQFTARNTRISAVWSASQLPARLLLRAPSEFFRLMADGLLPDISPNLLDRPRMLAAYILNAALIIMILIRGLSAKAFNRRMKLWLILVMFLPFALFVRDDPTIRQLAVIWVPFCLLAGLTFSRFRWSGPVTVLLCLASLVPYYRCSSFPYHPSDWRTAVAMLEEKADPDDPVLVVGGKSTGLIFDYYSSGFLARTAPGGEDPYAADLARLPSDPAASLDSLMERGSRTWILVDVWGGTTAASVSRGYHLEDYTLVSPNMEFGLITRGD
jgi:uncharacterized membrane protein